MTHLPVVRGRYNLRAADRSRSFPEFRCGGYLGFRLVIHSSHPNKRKGRGLRGGSWSSGPRFVRSAYRVRFPPASRLTNLGFRVAIHGRDIWGAETQQR